MRTNTVRLVQHHPVATDDQRQFNIFGNELHQLHDEHAGDDQLRRRQLQPGHESVLHLGDVARLQAKGGAILELVHHSVGGSGAAHLGAHHRALHGRAAGVQGGHVECPRHAHRAALPYAHLLVSLLSGEKVNINVWAMENNLIDYMFVVVVVVVIDTETPPWKSMSMCPWWHPTALPPPGPTPRAI